MAFSQGCWKKTKPKQKKKKDPVSSHTDYNSSTYRANWQRLPLEENPIQRL